MGRALAEVIQFERTAFETSRDLDFFTVAGLTAQIGYGPDLWPIVVAKELIDNSLDACESKDVTPEIIVTLAANSLDVADNGPGIPAHIIERSIIYKSRISDKRHYVSPTRGQFGNALKCIWAVPFVVGGNKGAVIEVTACGVRHRIAVSLDHIKQEPDIRMTAEPFVQIGTSVKVRWPGIASLTASPETMDLYNGPVADALRIAVAGFAAFNPHATFRLKLPARDEVTFAASNPDWPKWRPNQPTSAHWYSPEHLRDLIAAHVSEAEKDGKPACSVREFVSGFDGLRRSDSQSLVTQEAGLSRHSLNELVQDRALPLLPIARLLDAMKKHSRPVEPKRLGVIGQEHLRASLEAQGAAPGSFRYKKCWGVGEDGLPYIVEVAFGVKDDGEDVEGRVLHMGLNFSPIFKIPSDHLNNLLAKCHVEESDPVTLLIHQCCPRFAFADSGKGTVTNDGDEDGIAVALTSAIEKVTAGFKREKRRSIAQAGAQEDAALKQDARDRLCRKKQSRDEIKEAAYEVMEEAYNFMSDGGRFPATARQVMYAARPRVLAKIDKCWDKSTYFTQKLLPDYVKEFSDKTKDWDVVFDARGHLVEPHIREIIPLGTLNVRDHVETWDRHQEEGLHVEIDARYPTCGPRHRYRFALYIEKEGFEPLLRQARIAERYDLTIFSSKGYSVTAARKLVDEWARRGVTILVFHDFDIDGLGIAHTLTNDTRRYEFATKPKIIDLGLRLDDVKAMNLASEPWEKPRLKKNPRGRLERYGATEEEINFLIRGRLSPSRGFYGQRVELNAMTSPQFIKLLETKLVEAGVKKVIPNSETLQRAYRRGIDIRHLEASLKAIQANPYRGLVPKNLQALVVKRLAEHPELSWDQAVLLETKEN